MECPRPNVLKSWVVLHVKICKPAPEKGRASKEDWHTLKENEIQLQGEGQKKEGD